MPPLQGQGTVPPLPSRPLPEQALTVRNTGMSSSDPR